MSRRLCVLVLLLLAAIVSGRAAGPTVTIDAAAPSARVSPLLYGLMTEEINHAYDGGLYAELIHNRAFLDNAQSPVRWSVVQRDGSAAAIALAADPQATNSIDAPRNVVPVGSKLTGVKSGFTYTVPASGIAVLTLETR